MSKMSRVEILRAVVVKLTPMLAGKGLRVTQIGTQAFCRWDKAGKPVQINIPFITHDADEQFCRAIQGFIDHEVAHVLFTDWAVPPLAAQRGAEKAKEMNHEPKAAAVRMHSLHNIVEDTFIERKMCERFKGTGYNLDQLYEIFLKRITAKAVEETKGNPAEQFNVLLVPIIRAWSGQSEFQRFLDAGGHWEGNEYVKALADGLPQRVIDSIATAKNSWDCLDIAEALYNVLYPKIEPPAAAPPSPISSPSDEESEDASDEKSDSKTGSGSATEKPEDKDDKGSKGETKDTDDTSKDKGDGKAEKDEKDEADDAGADKADGGDDGEDDGEASEPEDEGPGDAGEDPGTGDEEPAGEEADDTADYDAGGEDEPDSDTDGDDRGDDDDETDSEAEDDEDDGEDTDGDEAGGKAGSDAANDDSDDDDGSEPSAAGEPGDDDAGEQGSGKGAGGESAEESDLEGGEAVATVKSPFGDIDVDPTRDIAKVIATMIGDEALRETRGADYRILTRDWDRIEVPKEDKARPVRTREIERLEEETRHMIGPMQKSIERMMAARSLVTKVPGYRSGRLHGGSLYRLAVSDDRVFRRTHVNHSKETAVTLLIDNSGSMSGRKVETAMKSGYALSQTLERVDVKNEAIGFTAYAPSREQIAVKEEEEERIGLPFHRYEPIYMPLYKGFDERLSPDIKKRFVMGYNGTVSLSGNIDGESVRYAGHRLLRRPEVRKVMIVLSDGMPAGHSMAAYHGGTLNSDLHNAITELEKQNVEVIGLGIMTEAVATFYKKHSILHNLDALPKIVIGELQRILSAA